MTTWRKSSHSTGEDTAQCVEVSAVWRKSSHSGGEDTSSCVEVAALWRKSSYSGVEDTESCVEVAALPTVIAVRDSKDPEGPRLHFGQGEWAGFLAVLKEN